MASISAFTYDLSFHEASKNQIHREDIVFEHVRFEPASKNIEINLMNIGTVNSDISTITIVNIDNQEIIANWVDINQPLQIQANQKIFLCSPDILLPIGLGTWDEPVYRDSDYKISLTTVRGNFFTTVATPYNT